MHIPPQFNETRAPILQRLIHQHPLATFIVCDDELLVNHFPLVLHNAGEQGVLRGHIPRANTLWKSLGNGLPAVAVFQGPEAYITPSWYPGKQQHGKVVPTWNYVVVHAHGRAKAVHDPDWLLAHLNALTTQQETSQTQPWKVSDAPSDFTVKLIAQLVGIEVSITSLAGKWKVSQNRPQGDQLGVAAGLRRRGSDDDLAMEKLVLNHSDLQFQGER